ncbi:MAG: hypothetical protein DI538_23600 [Azospira oryzae]|jgi:hypothetical protein|nr:MAG: hypothetical protein DI538_23600 [Azospira oryzae]
MKWSALSFFLLLFIGCDELGADKYHRMSDDKRIRFSETEILSYSSDSKTEKYEVLKIVNGQYADSRSGTCGKPRSDVYDYQVVYLRPLDSLNTNYYFVSEHTDDCQHYPRLTQSNLIQSLNGSYHDGASDRIVWLDEFDDLISSFKKKHDRLTIRHHTYEQVMEFMVVNGKRMDKLYYTRASGFVGYQLKDKTMFELVNP